MYYEKLYFYLSREHFDVMISMELVLWVRVKFKMRSMRFHSQQKSS